MNLIEELAQYSSDPYGFVLFAFPWGEAGTELENYSGPLDWQITVLEDLGRGLITFEEAIQIARTSGHGIGKSALVAWIILWAISTYEDTKGVVTANTENQLKTKTWAEVAKWHRMFIAREYFTMTATALFARDPLHERTWRIDMVPWSERNTEAFAGLHNKGRRLILIFDEASAIPDVIWETSEGALTDRDTQIIWCAFGNPTRNTGRFRACFPGGVFAHRWNHYRVDSRTVRFSNKLRIAAWIEDYGLESDFVKVRILGEFPAQGVSQFISLMDVEAAIEREAVALMFDPLILGVDVARFGENESVIFPRKGLDARTIPFQRFLGLDTVQLAGKVAETAISNRADAVFVDEGGVGGGVVDILRRVNKVNVIGIQFGSKSDRQFDELGERYAQKRSEMWGLMRWHIRKGLALPNDKSLKEQLCAPEYSINLRDAIQLEKKEDMSDRGAPSPDIADALALTFAYPVAPNALAGYLGAQQGSLVKSEWDPVASEALAA